MSENKSFASAFLPGLAVGLILGSLFGAFVAPMLVSPSRPAPGPVPVKAGAGSATREPVPATPEAPVKPEEKPVDPAAAPGAQTPGDPKPADPKPAEPAPGERPK